MSGLRSRSSIVSNSGTTGSRHRTTPSFACQEAGFLRQQVDDEQVRHTAGHRHDQAADPGGSVVHDLVAEHPVGAQDRVGFRPDRDAGGGERAWRGELLLQQRQPLRLVPLREVLATRHPGGGQQLGDGEVVESAVLADVEHRQVEPERLGQANDGLHVMICQSPCAGFFQQAAHQPQIVHQLRRVLISHARCVGFALDDATGEVRPNQVDRLAPRLVGVSRHGARTDGTERGGPGIDPRRELARCPLDQVGQAEVGGEPGELAVQQRDRTFAQRVQ